jgi:hypothetical protein
LINTLKPLSPLKDSRYLFLIVFVLSQLVASAQVLVGPVVGTQYNFGAYDNKDYKDLYSVRYGLNYHAGLSVALRVQKTFFLQTTILYNQRKKVMEGKLDPLFYHEVKNQFIDIPILFTKEVKAKLGADKYYKWYLGFGPNISYWLGGKGELMNSELNENEISPPDYKIEYTVAFNKDPEVPSPEEMIVQKPNRYQLGLNFSAGVIFEPENLNKFMVTARYQMGHTFMSQESKGVFGYPGQLYYEDDLRIRNHSLSLSLYYFIDLKTSERKKGASTIKPHKKR